MRGLSSVFVRRLAAVGLGVGLLSAGVCVAAEKETLPKPKYSLEEIMKKGHKGNNSLAKHASDGKATEKELDQLLEYYRSMQEQKPPKGDLTDWKQRTNALLSSVEKIKAGDRSAVAIYKKAVNCKACHNLHKED